MDLFGKKMTFFAPVRQVVVCQKHEDVILVPAGLNNVNTDGECYRCRTEFMNSIENDSIDLSDINELLSKANSRRKLYNNNNKNSNNNDDDGNDNETIEISVLRLKYLTSELEKSRNKNDQLNKLLHSYESPDSNLLYESSHNNHNKYRGKHHHHHHHPHSHKNAIGKESATFDYADMQIRYSRLFQASLMEMKDLHDHDKDKNSRLLVELNRVQHVNTNLEQTLQEKDEIILKNLDKIDSLTLELLSIKKKFTIQQEYLIEERKIASRVNELEESLDTFSKIKELDDRNIKKLGTEVTHLNKQLKSVYHQQGSINNGIPFNEDDMEMKMINSDLNEAKHKIIELKTTLKDLQNAKRVDEEHIKYLNLKLSPSSKKNKNTNKNKEKYNIRDDKYDQNKHAYRGNNNNNNNNNKNNNDDNGFNNNGYNGYNDFDETNSQTNTSYDSSYTISNSDDNTQNFETTTNTIEYEQQSTRQIKKNKNNMINNFEKLKSKLRTNKKKKKKTNNEDEINNDNDNDNKTNNKNKNNRKLSFSSTEEKLQALEDSIENNKSLSKDEKRDLMYQRNNELRKFYLNYRKMSI